MNWNASGQCPACAAALWAEALLAPERCPRCGTDLWAARFSGGLVFFVRWPGESLSEFLARLAGDRLGLSPAEMEMVLESADSLDVLELLYEIEAGLRSGSAP